MGKMFFDRGNKFFKNGSVLDRLVLPPFAVQRGTVADLCTLGNGFELCKFGKILLVI